MHPNNAIIARIISSKSAESMKVQTCGHSSANGSNVGTNKKHAAADDDGLVKLQNDLFQRASTRDLYLPFFLPLLTVKRQSHCISFLPCKIYTDMGSSPRGSMPTANLQSTISSIQVSLKMLKTLNISRRILLQVHCRGIQTHRAATTTIGLSPSSMMGQAARKEREEGNVSFSVSRVNYCYCYYCRYAVGVNLDCRSALYSLRYQAKQRNHFLPALLNSNAPSLVMRLTREGSSPDGKL